MNTHTHTHTPVLTYKFWSSEYVFKIVAKVDLVCQAEVDELDARMRHRAVQQHDVFRLQGNKKRDGLKRRGEAGGGRTVL